MEEAAEEDEVDLDQVDLQEVDSRPFGAPFGAILIYVKQHSNQ